MYLLFEKPFWALLSNLSLTFFSLLFNALDKILYIQLKSEMGLQLLIFVQSPFLGINFIVADLKGGVSSPLRKQQSEYFFRGTLNHFQNLLMN